MDEVNVYADEDLVAPYHSSTCSTYGRDISYYPKVSQGEALSNTCTTFRRGVGYLPTFTCLFLSLNNTKEFKS